MTDMKKGMVLAGVGLDFRRHDYINREVVQELAHTIVKELQPRYGYCTGIWGWNGAWGAALLQANVPYCMLLPYRSVGTRWFHGDKTELDTYTSKAEDVVYISDRYHEGVYRDRDKYLLAHVEGIASLRRPFTASKLIAMAEEQNVPVMELWVRYNHLALDNQEGTP